MIESVSSIYHNQFVINLNAVACKVAVHIFFATICDNFHLCRVVLRLRSASIPGSRPSPPGAQGRETSPRWTEAVRFARLASRATALEAVPVLRSWTQLFNKIPQQVSAPVPYSHQFWIASQGLGSRNTSNMQHKTMYVSRPLNPTELPTQDGFKCRLGATKRLMKSVAALRGSAGPTRDVTRLAGIYHLDIAGQRYRYIIFSAEF